VNHKYCPLCDAAESGDPDILRILLDAGAEVNKYCPLCRATDSGNPDILRILLEAGADVNKYCPLCDAAESGNPDIVRVLLDAGANINMESADGKTPVIIAREKGHEFIESMIMQVMEEQYLVKKKPLVSDSEKRSLGVSSKADIEQELPKSKMSAEDDIAQEKIVIKKEIEDIVQEILESKINAEDDIAQEKIVIKEEIEDIVQEILESKISAEDDIAREKIVVKDKVIDIEQELPKSNMTNKEAIAVVIGNRDYQKTKNVDYAINDAQAIKKYLLDVLGYKEGNIFFYENASGTDFELLFGNKESYRGKLYNAVKLGKSDVIVYYSGHGAPGLKDKKGYFVPVNADPQYLELSGYPIEVFYKNLSKVRARSITVILDACFSGATIYDNISLISLKSKKPELYLKKGVVLSSSSGIQVSSWYNEKKHGMFTYFFLKAIHNKNADYDKDNKLTFEEIYKYISDKTEGVPYYARRIHGVEQDPTIEGQYKGRVLVRY
jgi:hypothetical protein